MKSSPLFLVDQKHTQFHTILQEKQSKEMATDQYIFTLSEFEADSFDASAFLARYRRVATLDSLRAQVSLLPLPLRMHFPRCVYKALSLRVVFSGVN
jgi:hypothetical protein